MEQASKKMHYGFLIVAVVFIEMLIIGGVFFGCSGLFLVPVTESLGIGQAKFSMYLTFQQISMGVAVIIAPKLMAKFKYKRINMVAIIPLALGFPVMAFATNEFYLYAGGILIGVGLCFITFLAPGTILPRWFKSKLNSMIALAAAGIGIGGMLMNPIISALINGPALLGFAESWRSAYLVVGIAVFVICFPLSAFVLKDFPEEKGLKAYEEGAEKETESVTPSKRVVEGVNKADAIKNPSFALWMVNILSWSLATTIITYFPAYAASTAAASTASFDLVGLINSVENIGAMLGGFIIGYLFDKFDVKVGSVYAAVAGVIGLLIMLFAKNSAVMMLVGSFLFGNYYQIANVSMPAMVTTMYGAKDYDQIFPLGAAIGPWVGAVAYLLWGFINDATGTLSASLYVVIGMCVITAVSAVTAVMFSKKLPRQTETIDI